MEFWNYILENFLLLAVFFAGYELFLKNSKFFTFSRFYLIFGILISFILPLFHYSIQVELHPEDFMNGTSVNFASLSQNLTNISLRNSINFEGFIFSVYLLISLVFFVRFLFQLLQLKKLIIASENISKIKGLKLKRSPKNCGAFSFFNYIFLDKISEKKDKNYVLRHELIHAQHYHSLDVLFINLASIFFWFNPLMYYYKKRIIDNLEFITDDAVMAKISSENLKNELKNYQYQLLSQSLAIQHLPILSFNHSSIKKRIIMLNKKAGNKLQLFKIFLLIPCLCFIFYSCNVDEVASLDENAEYSFYFDKNTSEENLQNRVKIFNHFYKTEVALKITDTKYQNQFLNQFTVSRKFKDQSNFTSGYQATGIAEENISFLVTYREGKIILNSNNSYRIELDNDANRMIISESANKK